MALLDGPRLAPRSGGKADSLVVLIHGYGADGRDLIDLGGPMGELLPGAAFVSPHGPEPCAEAPVGRQWFSLASRDPHDIARGAAAAWPVLRSFLAEELSSLGLPPQRLALVGFSQGTMMALHAVTAGGVAAGAVVGYSGLWTQAAGTPTALEHLPPILLVHGSDDEVIPPAALFGSANALAAAGGAAQWHLSFGLGHGIDEAGLFHGAHFLAQMLGPARG